MFHALITAAVAFGFGFVGSMPLTGPISVLVVSRAAQKDFAQSLRIGLGAAAAEGIYAGIAYFGFATFLARHPLVLPISHAVSAVVLSALGVYFLSWKERHLHPRERKNRLSGFWLGFTVSAFNPTLLATWTAGVTALYARQWVEFSMLLTVPFALAGGGGVATWEVLSVALLRRFADRFPRRAIMWVIRAMGLVVLAGGVWSGVDFVRGLRHPSAPGAPDPAHARAVSAKPSVTGVAKPQL